MPRAFRLEYADVQTAIDSGAQDVSWVSQELRRVDLCDKRLDRRLIKSAQQLAASPASPINEACGDWSSTQATYRLFDNDKVTACRLLEPHRQQTLKRMRACEGPVLSIQDTVLISYKHAKTQGLGPVGNSNSAEGRGLIMHHALAFTTQGVPLGLLSQSIWARPYVSQESYQERIERLQVTPIEKKESFKLLVALQESVRCTPPGVKLITIADRESDFFEFIAAAEELRTRYVIRARSDRYLVPEDSEGYERMLEAINAAGVIGTLSVEIPSNGKRQARTASVAARIARVSLKPPHRRGKAKLTGSQEPVSINVVAATEQNAPKGIEPISWVLLTNERVQDFDSAAEKIEWYGCRWGIETWHKVLKAGCKVEDCRLDQAARLKRHLALFSIISVRLMYVTYLARVNPDLPATEVFSAEELEALHVRAKKTLPPRDPPSLREAVRLIGRMGGHLGRKCDGEPGVTVLWRGWLRLHEDVAILRAHKEALGLVDSS